MVGKELGVVTLCFLFHGAGSPCSGVVSSLLSTT